MAPRRLNKLSARAVATLKKPGRHSDGGGLYLSVGPGEARRWVFLFRWRGKPREMGLGSAKSVSLARAREKAADARAMLADGVNPLHQKRLQLATPAFMPFAEDVIEALSSQWRSAKHAAQWRATLEAHAGPLHALPVDRIETEDVLATLKPIWNDIPETANRVRGRIEKVLDAATAHGFRSGENPARWRGHLENLLPKRQKLSRGRHPALPIDEMAGFMAALQKRQGVAALALEFVILTAARSGEVRGATWSEIDLKAGVWTIPAQRMKSGREHRVPLSDAAMAVLKTARPLTDGAAHALIFPGTKGGPLSDMSLAAVLRRMGYPRERVSVHGFRSTFRDWVSERTDFPRELAESALAHIVGDATERAYRRGDALARRREMMEAWAQQIGG